MQGFQARSVTLQILGRMQPGETKRCLLACERHQQQPHSRVQTGIRRSLDFPRTCLTDGDKNYPVFVPYDRFSRISVKCKAPSLAQTVTKLAIVLGCFS